MQCSAVALGIPVDITFTHTTYLNIIWEVKLMITEIPPTGPPQQNNVHRFYTNHIQEWVKEHEFFWNLQHNHKSSICVLTGQSCFWKYQRKPLQYQALWADIHRPTRIGYPFHVSYPLVAVIFKCFVSVFNRCSLIIFLNAHWLLRSPWVRHKRTFAVCCSIHKTGRFKCVTWNVSLWCEVPQCTTQGPIIFSLWI